MMKPLINEFGITIKQLKELVKDLPEQDSYGQDYEVWISSNDRPRGTSNSCKSIYQLNEGDIILDI